MLRAVFVSGEDVKGAASARLVPAGEAMILSAKRVEAVAVWVMKVCGDFWRGAG